MIPRKLLNPILRRLDNGKAIIILGPRQSGKTTLLNMIAREASTPFLLLDCDEPDIRKLLETPTSTALKNIIGKNKLVVTGSSALEFADEINEPLTGRKIEYFLLPISVEEMLDYHGRLEEKRLLEALALQIGSQVSFNEPAQLVGVNRETIQRYIDLLEKTFVVFRLRSFSRNVRNELKKKRDIQKHLSGHIRSMR